MSFTICLANWDIMHIGGHFSLANRVILSVHCFVIHVIISSVKFGDGRQTAKFGFPGLFKAWGYFL